MKKKLTIDVSEPDKESLVRMSRSQAGSARMVLRAKIILCRAGGMSKSETARKLGISEVTVQTWTDRFRSGGVAALSDRKGRGRKPSIPPAVRERIVVEATRPPAGHTRHSTRTMARAVGVSQHTVRLIWNRSGIKPHLTRTFKVSRDPDFAAKFWDVVGLYLAPPENAVVFCCDEKTQCQALERTQPGLPLGVGHIRTKSHDYTRHGTTTLFAALDYATGRVVHAHHQTHTHREWLSFLRKIDRSVPWGTGIHIVLDNYCTHRHEAVGKWLEAHPRFRMHYTPTSSSWLNLVERFFGEITRDCIRDGSFTSVAELEKAMASYISAHNERPTRFVWKAKGEEILRNINRAREVLGIPRLPETEPGGKNHEGNSQGQTESNVGKVFCNSAH